MRRTCLTQNTWKVSILTCEIMAKRRAVIFNKYILVKPRFEWSKLSLAAAWLSLPLASFQPVYPISPLLCGLPTTMPCCFLSIPFKGRQGAK